MQDLPQTLTPRLPLFAYGTLKPSVGSLLEGLIEGSLPGYLESYELRDAGGYPLAFPNAEKRLEGELVWLRLQDYDQIISLLDNYEGEEFSRCLEVAHTKENSCPVECWVYICNLKQREDFAPIASGIWRKQKI